MITSSKWFDILKWFALIGLPALKVAIPELFSTWGIPYGDQIATTLDTIAVLLGTWLGVSNVTYYVNKSKEAENEDPYAQ